MGLFLRGVIGHRWLEGHRLSVLWSLRVTLRHLPSPPHPHLFLAGPASFSATQGSSSGFAGSPNSYREYRWTRPWRGNGVWGTHDHGLQLLWGLQDGTTTRAVAEPPTVTVRKRSRDTTRETLSLPAPLREKLAILQEYRERDPRGASGKPRDRATEC